jgi:hypothetical protein
LLQVLLLLLHVVLLPRCSHLLLLFFKPSCVLVLQVRRQGGQRR